MKTRFFNPASQNNAAWWIDGSLSLYAVTTQLYASLVINMIGNVLFDTIYHTANGMEIFDFISSVDVFHELYSWKNISKFPWKWKFWHMIHLLENINFLLGKPCIDYVSKWLHGYLQHGLDKFFWMNRLVQEIPCNIRTQGVWNWQ